MLDEGNVFQLTGEWRVIAFRKYDISLGHPLEHQPRLRRFADDTRTSRFEANNGPISSLFFIVTNKRGLPHIETFVEGLYIAQQTDSRGTFQEKSLEINFYLPSMQQILETKPASPPNSSTVIEQQQVYMGKLGINLIGTRPRVYGEFSPAQ